MKEDEVYKQHILEAIAKIQTYLEGVDLESFVANSQLFDACVRQLEIIGEACSHFGNSFRMAHPHVPFNKIIAMRNKIIHEYFGIDEQVVWETCKRDLPELKISLHQ